MSVLQHNQETKICSRCKLLLPLDNFHIERRASDGHFYICKKCRNKTDRKRYSSNLTIKERKRLSDKKYRDKFPEKYREVKRKATLKFKYGITAEEWNDIYNRQNGKCAICDKHQSEFNHRLCVDHDHVSQEVRGLLCDECNFLVGKFECELLTDTIYKNIIKYLKKGI
jgi:uncharacterized protein YlaI